MSAEHVVVIPQAHLAPRSPRRRGHSFDYQQFRSSSRREFAHRHSGMYQDRAIAAHVIRAIACCRKSNFQQAH